MKSAFALLGLVLLTTPAFAFWSTGHMIISTIAYNEIQRMDPTYLKTIQKEIDYLSEYSMENAHSFIESAVWADDNKGIAWTAFNDWHFVDTPVLEEGWSGDTETELMNATWAIYSMRKTLTNKYTPKFDSGLALSFAWRYLIHLVGDIHQPLHASTYYSSKFPHGDRGGNSFKINYPDNKEITQLHALWDACVDQYGSIYAPLSDSEFEYLSAVASNLTQNITRKDVADRLKTSDERIWAAESHDFAENFLYKDIEYGQTPSKEYIEGGRKIVNEQLVVAGYRLADLMITLKHKTETESIIKELISE